MKVVILLSVFLSFYYNDYAQSLKMISLTSEDDVSIFLVEENISNVELNSNTIILKLNSKTHLNCKIDSLTEILLLFSYDCNCSVSISLLPDDFPFRPQELIIYYDNKYSVIQENEIKIFHGHLRIAEEEKKKLLEVFKGFIK